MSSTAVATPAKHVVMDQAIKDLERALDALETKVGQIGGGNIEAEKDAVERPSPTLEQLLDDAPQAINTLEKRVYALKESLHTMLFG